MQPGKLPKSADKYIKKLLLKIPTKKSQAQRDMSGDGNCKIHIRQLCIDKNAHITVTLTELVIYYAYLY